MTGEFGPLRVDKANLAKIRAGVEPGPENPEATQQVEATGAELEPDQETLGEHTIKPYESFELPGSNEPKASCGEWQPAGVCETCGHLDLTVNRCGRRTCRDCWHKWARDASVRAATRIQSWRHTQQGWRQQAAHAVVSAPEGAIQSTREFWNGKSRAAEIAESKGWRGFAVIAHPWRATETAKKEYREAEPGVGLWVWLRQTKDDIYQWIRWSPHYHIIGATGADMEPAKESDEWVYTFIRSCKNYGGISGEDSHEDVYGLFRYLLSHTGWPEGCSRQAITWYGCLANNVFVEDATEDWQHEKPSDGVVSALRRHIEEVAGVEDSGEEEGEGGGGDEQSECPVDDCDGLIIGVFDVRAFLEQQNRPREIEHKMRTARKWRLGETRPPPGAQFPQSEAEARESWALVLD
jgi:hypothetical protein